MRPEALSSISLTAVGAYDLPVFVTCQIFAGLAFVMGILVLGYLENGLFYLKDDPLESAALILALLISVTYLKISTFLEIQDNRWLINSGYYTFWKQKVDIHEHVSDWAHSIATRRVKMLTAN